MLTYYLAMQPQLFAAAVDEQLRRLQAEKHGGPAATALAAGAPAPGPAALLPPSSDQADNPPPAPTPHPEMMMEGDVVDDNGDEGDASTNKNNDNKNSKNDNNAGMAVLKRRIDEARAAEARATLEDLLYVSILERFVLLGVEMLPRLDGVVDARQANLLALTEGIHSKEALELVREHLLSATGVGGGGAGGSGGASAAFSNALVKMSKFQMAQVYAASVMFGYFLRRVDKRFQLEKAVGVLDGPGGGGGGARSGFGASALAQGSLDSVDGAAAAAATNEEAVARLEALLARAADMEVADDPDSAPSTTDEEAAGDERRGRTVNRTRAAGQQDDDKPPPPPPRDLSPRSRRGSSPTLRAYIERFDPQTMAQTARVVSVEGAAVVERQTTALFGDVKLLTQQMQAALRAGGPVTSPSELYARIERAVAENAVETLAMTVGAQRRVVLEAVAFGAFLRDVEDRVDVEFGGLLTPMPPPPGGGGRGGPGMLGPGGGGGGGGGSDSDDDDGGRGRGGGGGGNIRRSGPALTM